MNDKITPQIALQNLDLAASLVNGTRKDHAGLAESVNVLQALIDAQKPAPVVEPK